MGPEGPHQSEVAKALADRPAKAVLLTHSETSTGVIAGPGARPGRPRGRRARDRRRRLEPRGGAVRVRRVGDRRRGRRVAEGARRFAGPRVRRDLGPRVGGARHRDDAAVLLRLVDLQGVRRAQAPGEPVDPGDQRDAGPARRARAVLPGRRRRRDGAAPDALARGEGGRPGARPRPVRRGPRRQLDRHGDPRSRGPRRRHDQRPDALGLRRVSRRGRGRSRGRSSGSGTSATSASSTSSAGSRRSR